MKKHIFTLLYCILLCIVLVSCSQTAIIGQEKNLSYPESSVSEVEKANKNETPFVSYMPITDDVSNPATHDKEQFVATQIDYSSYKCTASSSLLEEITIKEINWDLLKMGKQYDTVFRNETIDFCGFSFSIADCYSDDSNTRFSILLELPKEWSDLECLSMNPCLGFRFYLDKQAVNDFMLIDQSVIVSEALDHTRCGSFTMTYQSNRITNNIMHTAHEWTIVPYYYHWKWFAGTYFNNRPDSKINLHEGEVCKFIGTEDRYSSGEIEIVELEELSLTLPISHKYESSMREREPLILPVSVWADDIERNEALGYYDDTIDYVPFYYGTIQMVQADFSDFEINIERFYYWEHGFFFILHYTYPEDWPDEYRRNINLSLDIYADGQLFGAPNEQSNYMPCFGGAQNVWLQKNPKEWGHFPSEVYSIFDQKNFSLSNPIPAKELKFCFSYRYISEVTKMGNNVTYMLQSGDPVYIDDNISIKWETIPLLDITVSTDQFTFSQGDKH